MCVTANANVTANVTCAYDIKEKDIWSIWDSDIIVYCKLCTFIFKLVFAI